MNPIKKYLFKIEHFTNISGIILIDFNCWLRS